MTCSSFRPDPSLWSRAAKRGTLPIHTSIHLLKGCMLKIAAAGSQSGSGSWRRAVRAAMAALLLYVPPASAAKFSRAAGALRGSSSKFSSASAAVKGSFTAYHTGGPRSCAVSPGPWGARRASLGCLGVARVRPGGSAPASAATTTPALYVFAVVSWA